MSAILTEAVESGHIVKNPVKHVDLPKCKRTEETPGSPRSRYNSWSRRLQAGTG
jgi:hypothetical protein